MNDKVIKKRTFLDSLPRHEAGHQNGKIDWKSSVGQQVKFIYTNNKTSELKVLEGYIEIIDYNKEKQLLTIKYNDIISEISNRDFRECKISNLVKEDIYRITLNKSGNKWVDLSRVPLRGKGIDWYKVAEMKMTIPFGYFGIEGEISIDSYKNQHLNITYKNYKDTIHRHNFANGKFGKLLKEEIYRPVFIEDNNRWVDLRSIPLDGNGIDWETAVRDKMIIYFKYDGLFGEVTILGFDVKKGMLQISYNNIITDMATSSFVKCYFGSILNKNNGRVIKGLNDIATTHKELVKYFVNEDDAYKYTYGTGNKIKLKCLDCGYEKEMLLWSVNRVGFGCPACNNGLSYPNKFMFNLLNQLNYKFKPEKSFKWLKGKRYDFYIPEINCVIEMHGEQHYKKSFHTIRKCRSLMEEQSNDKIKEDLAKNNGISHYITVDARWSTLEWIKTNILQSNLIHLCDLSNINWLECHKHACSNITKYICNIKKENPTYSTIDISKLTYLSQTTIIKYLKQGNDLGWCTYDKELELKLKGLKMSSGKHPMARKVICLTTNKIFETMCDGAEEYNIGSSHITSCCTGKRNFTGRHPETNEPLKWMYYSDYQSI